MAISPELLALSDLPEEDESFFEQDEGYEGYDKIEFDDEYAEMEEYFGRDFMELLQEYNATLYLPNDENFNSEAPYLVEFADRTIEIFVGDAEKDKFFILNFAMSDAYKNKSSYDDHSYYYEKPEEFDENGRKFGEFFRAATKELDPAAPLYISTEDKNIYEVYKRTFINPEDGSYTRQRIHIELQDKYGAIESFGTEDTPAHQTQ